MVEAASSGFALFGLVVDHLVQLGEAEFGQGSFVGSRDLLKTPDVSETFKKGPRGSGSCGRRGSLVVGNREESEGCHSPDFVFDRDRLRWFQGNFPVSYA